MGMKESPCRSSRLTRHSILLGFLAISITTTANGDEFDSQRRALDLITSTADRLCSVIATQGRTENSTIQGEIHAQLKGLASKFADAGISGSGTITNSQYQNVLQENLAETLKDNATCKMKVFGTLEEKLVTSPSGRGLSLAPTGVPKSVEEMSFGFDTPCERISGKSDAYDIIQKYGDQALLTAPVGRILVRDRPVILRQSVGGSDLGSLTANTRVRVICTEKDGKFAVIKQEQGSRGGVIETNALEAP